MFFVLPFGAIFAVIISVFDDDLGGYVLAAWIIVLIAFIAATLVLFMKKLFAVYRNVDADDKLMATITKLSTLSFISISITLSFPCISVIFPVIMDDDNITMLYVIEKYIVCLDVWSNLWCVLLTYNTFDPLYNNLCGCVHKRCQKVWSKWIESSGFNDERMMVKVVAAGDSQIACSQNETPTTTTTVQSVPSSSATDQDVADSGEMELELDAVNNAPTETPNTP
eukprot:CAMPEP_0197039850 /NCGR_PEP_ID=MMETSP1384-20130603/16622_1 /TAXON_ID=29189 /ORGANISM="Ammonia sp." /LENGTH=224 /DNA_ID=CAMNT_0042470513 /DNA_START=354 /DNA_END=1028 /DNA_ORIENTATION=-